MTQQEEKVLVESAFQALKACGWFSRTGLIPTEVTDRELAGFEEEMGLKLPPLYRTFLQSYHMDFHFWGIVHQIDGYTCPSPLTLFTGLKEARKGLLDFRSLAGDYFGAPLERYQHYLPIGLWDSDFLLWDLTKPENQVREDDWGESWTLVSLPHDEQWDEDFWKACGDPRVPNFKTLLDWFFCGTLIPEFEEENHLKVTYERMNNYDFLWHFYEDRWKEP